MKDIIQKIIKLLSTDKFIHSYLACIIFLTSYDIIQMFFVLKFFIYILIAAGITIILFVLKEIFDSHQNNNHFCFGDLIFDFFGLFYGIALILMMILFNKGS